MKTQQHNIRAPFRNTALGIIFAASVVATMPAQAGWFSNVGSKVHTAAAKVASTPGNIEAKVADISAKLNEMFQNIEENRPLAEHLKNGPLMKMVKETLSLMADMGSDYQQFSSSGEAESFRQDIKDIIADMSAISQQFGRDEVKRQRLAKIENLMDKIPSTFLFVMYEAAGDRVQTMKDKIAQLQARMSQLPSLPTISELSQAPENFTNEICPLVNDKPTKITVALLKVAIKDVSFIVKNVKDAMPEDIDINVDVVAGGGTTIKNPAQRVMQAITIVLDGLQLKIDNYETIAGAVCPGSK